MQRIELLPTFGLNGRLEVLWNLNPGAGGNWWRLRGTARAYSSSLTLSSDRSSRISQKRQSRPDPTRTDSFERQRRLMDYYPRVNARLIAKMERVIRAIALQFTIGGHADKSGSLRQMSTVYAEFQRLRDDELGTVDYRRSVQILTREKDTWIRRSEEEVVGGPWPTQVVTKQEFDGEWPFRVDRVILSASHTINGYAFALNGAAKSRFGILFPHDAGLAVLGRSVGAFTEVTRMLG